MHGHIKDLPHLQQPAHISGSLPVRSPANSSAACTRQVHAYQKYSCPHLTRKPLGRRPPQPATTSIRTDFSRSSQPYGAPASKPALCGSTTLAYDRVSATT
jgi:hypothetical protein